MFVVTEHTVAEQKFLNQPQPLRTDLEFVTDNKGFVDMTISPRR